MIHGCIIAGAGQDKSCNGTSPFCRAGLSLHPTMRLILPILFLASLVSANNTPPPSPQAGTSAGGSLSSAAPWTHDDIVIIQNKDIQGATPKNGPDVLYNGSGNLVSVPSIHGTNYELTLFITGTVDSVDRSGRRSRILCTAGLWSVYQTIMDVTALAPFTPCSRPLSQSKLPPKSSIHSSRGTAIQVRL